MNDRCFFDTNILIYLYSMDQPIKKGIAENIVLAHQNKAVISTQVLNEFINVMSKKKKNEHQVVANAVKELLAAFTISYITVGTIELALSISNKHNYAYYDSLIIASAIESNCNVLFTEDMHDEHIINKNLTINNPFNPSLP